MIDSLRSFKDDTDADVQVSNERKVEINGMKVTSFDVKKADMSAIVWLTIRDGFVYILSCGGRNSKLGQECLNAADTLVIK